MATSNEELRDALLRRQVGILQLSDKIVADLLRIINGSEPRLRSVIEEFLGVLATINLHTRRGRTVTKRLERAILAVRGEAIDRAAKELTRRMEELAVAEARAIGTAIQTAVPVEVNLSRPSTRRLKIIAQEVAPQGAATSRWFDGLKANDARLIAAEIAAGAAAGDSPDTITRRILGSKSLRGADGQTQKTRMQADAIVRTTIVHVADLVRQAMFNANSDVIDEEQYVATLDSRTTPICRSLDGKRFPVGTGPRPPQHWRCRSVRVPVLNGQLLGTRPAKPVTEKMLRREYEQSSTSLSFREWRKRRIRELVGPVPAETTYQEWLERQSVEFQEEVLGTTRAALFRRGDLPLERFVNRATGREWTLAQLARRELEAFRKAGLDVRRFR